MRTVDSPIGIPSLCSSTHIRCAVQHCFGAQRESHSFSLSHFSMCGRAASRTGVLCSAWRWYRRSLGAGSSRRSLATVLRERPNWLAAARWLLPWIKTQVRISSRSATGYTFPYLRSLEFAFEYSGLLGPVAHFWVSEWLTRMIAFTPGKQDCIILDITDNCLKHSLEPQTLGSALGTHLANGESLKEALRRTQQAEDKEEREKRQRTLVVGKRTQDLAVNILTRLDWHRQKDGSFLLTLGTLQHCIILVPSEERTGYYEVWAKLAPTLIPQRWLDAAPLDWAQQYAEGKARILLADPAKKVL